jgi:hypothetical protein
LPAAADIKSTCWQANLSEELATTGQSSLVQVASVFCQHGCTTRLDADTSQGQLMHQRITDCYAVAAIDGKAAQQAQICGAHQFEAKQEICQNATMSQVQNSPHLDVVSYVLLLVSHHAPYQQLIVC